MTVELDDRLRELFADERLDLPAPPDAADDIVAGARRRRRSRIAVAATFSLTVLLAGGIAVSGIGNLVNDPAAPARSTVVETATVTVPRPVVEPSGYSTYRLGMSVDELLASNPRLTYLRTGNDRCTVYVLDTVPGEAVVVSPRHVVVWIRLPLGAVTPSGVGAGSSVDDVLARYPEAERHGDRLTVRMTGTPEWQYTFPLDDAGKVSAVRMESNATECDLGDQ
ncbi:hypothetical protein ALI22I_38540 [Saccharothrix sp. ALI-22-I]|uniref:hypothetical protein n=1 Tax=Saccharothrix sp. ALI-22-I TaxID=1933778 RepID=UPI00097BEF60|nr:hypothetical protein [Saccharothrix sp. ALI-22-I]ONI82063.1 hypothetical protein ALI22I_38540 [Saccharothrix sp. ALI-22-I]